MRNDDPHSDVAIQPVEIDPLPTVQLVAVEADAELVGAQIAAIEREKQLAARDLIQALHCVGRDRPDVLLCR